MVLRDNIRNETCLQSRMDKLHQSQVKAYREAATKSIKEWAQSFPLQPMQEGDSKIVFANRCITPVTSASGENGLPNWKLNTAKLTAVNEIRKRAHATFEKYHPAEEDMPDAENEKTTTVATSTSVEVGTADEAEDDSEGGEETEDGELTGDDADVSDQERTSGKCAGPNRKKAKSSGVKKTVVQKKGTRPKSGYRNNRARRGGRGGGNRAQK